MPEVFHPGLFFSTKILIDYLNDNIKFDAIQFLDLGCGSGLISILAAKKNAVVFASDINIHAINNTLKNLEMNKQKATVIYSDLFDQIPRQIFDIIVINPPYFRGIAQNDAEKAWYAGKDLEFFQNLFQQLPDFMNFDSETIMILSDECEIGKIREYAETNNFLMVEVYRKERYWEINFIFKITKNKN